MSTTIPSRSVAQAADRLAARLPRGAVTTEATGVAVAGRLWNRQVERHPAMIVTCRTTADVQAAVVGAAEAGLPLSVLGGGHDWAANGLRDGSMTLDLGSMREVRIEGTTARVAGGATSSDLLDAALPHKLGAAVGTVGAVGVVGLVLGGGLSPLAGIAGLGVDNLLGAEVVLADGHAVWTDAHTEPDLFWALRGGGGNFGVVTRANVRLHPIPEVTTGLIEFPWHQAHQVLGGWSALTRAADDALDVMFGALATPDGLVLFTAPTWAGNAAEGHNQVNLVRALGDPVRDVVARIPLAQAVHVFDADYPPGGNYHLTSRTLPGLHSDAVKAFVAAAEAMPARCVLNVHHIHGAATRVAQSDTAYAYRDEHLVVEILGCWTDGDGLAERSWVRTAQQLLDPHALPGGWANLMARDDPRAADAYGPNTARLLAAKRRYDPLDRFAGTPLPPSTT